MRSLLTIGMLAVALSGFGQAFSLSDIAFSGGTNAASVPSCPSWIAFWSQNAGSALSSGVAIAQKVRNTTSSYKAICNLKFIMGRIAAGSVHAEIWSERTGGFQYGGLSSSVNPDGATEVTWAERPEIPPNTDFWIRISIDTGAYSLFYQYTDPYEAGLGYNLWINGSESYAGVTIDLCFDLGAGSAIAGPTSIAGLLNWWDYSDYTKATIVNGKFAMVADKGANSNAVVQATESRQPSLVTVNGRSGASFSAASVQRMDTASLMDLDDASAVTVFVVGDPVVLGGLTVLFECGTSDEAGNYFGLWMTDIPNVEAAIHGGSWGAHINPTAFYPNLSDFAGTFDLAEGGTTETTAYVNGSTATGSRPYSYDNAGTFTSWRGSIGGRYTGGLEYNGTIHSVLVYGRKLTAGELTTLHTWAGARFGY